PAVPEAEVVGRALAAPREAEGGRRPPPPRRAQRGEDERQRARAAAGVVVGADVAAAAAGGVDRDALRRVDALGERALLPRRAVDADARVDDALPRRRIAHRPRLGRALERRRAHVGHAQLLHLVAHVAGAAVAAARLHAGAVPALLVGVAGDVGAARVGGAVAAELVGRAAHAEARIVDALGVLAHLVRAAQVRQERAVVGRARAVGLAAHRRLGARHRRALGDARALDADVERPVGALGAIHLEARVGQAVVVLAALAGRAAKLALGARRGALPVDAQAAAADVGALVDLAVAVVVDAVAHLGRGRAAAHALQAAVHAEDLALLAVADVRAARLAHAGDVVVDDAVAVVVEAVAHLGRPARAAGADEAELAHARQRPRRAHARAHVARRAGAGHVVVDLPVAVVVEPVADLGGRVDLAAALRRPLDAHDLALLALAGADRPARRAHVDRIVVDEPVAVVVEPVALLVGGRRAAPAHEHAVDARLGARTALAHVRAARLAHADRHVVDHPVAVVVEPVAHLGAGVDGAHAHRHAHATGQDAELARAHVRRAARAHVVQALVDEPVAVVVLAVAHFGLGLILRAAGVRGAAGGERPRALEDARAALAHAVAGLADGEVL